MADSAAHERAESPAKEAMEEALVAKMKKKRIPIVAKARRA